MLKDSKLFRHQAYINAEWADADSGKTFKVLNPFNAEVIAEVADMVRAETKRAIDAAHAAYLLWRDVPAVERAACLRKLASLMEEHAEDLAILLTTEQGKPLSQAQGEVLGGAAGVLRAAEAATRVHGETLVAPSPDQRHLTIRQPIGVVATIMPWNFPVWLAANFCFSAIAAGCAVVLKPSQDTPLTSLALAELSERAGLPKGLFNVVTCDDPTEVGKELSENVLVRKLLFTGSTRAGKILYGQCADTIKSVSLELGGNGPFLVFDDADVDAAVEGALGMKALNSGQVCVNINRFLVHEKVHDEFVEKFAKVYGELRLDSGLNDPDQGPLINEAGIKKVETLVEDAVSKGAIVKIGGQRAKDVGELFYQPTILTGMTKEMRIYQEEIFGPVAAIFTFSSEEEAIKMANDTEYGLAAYLYSQNAQRAWRVMERIEAGTVGVNVAQTGVPFLPAGGFKHSGVGRQGGLDSLDPFTEVKSVCMAI